MAPYRDLRSGRSSSGGGAVEEVSVTANPDLQRVQGMMVFLASTANGLEEVLGRGAGSVTLAVTRAVLRRKTNSSSASGRVRRIAAVA